MRVLVARQNEREPGCGRRQSNVGALHRLWGALPEGWIVTKSTAEELNRPRNDVPEEEMRYGMGLWLHWTGSALVLEGYDAGASFCSTHDPGRADDRQGPRHQ